MVLLTSSGDDRDMGPVPLTGIYDRLTKPVRRVQGVGTLNPDATKGNPKVAPFRLRPTCRYIASGCSPCATLNGPSQEWVADGLQGLLVFDNATSLVVVPGGVAVNVAGDDGAAGLLELQEDHVVRAAAFAESEVGPQSDRADPTTLCTMSTRRWPPERGSTAAAVSAGSRPALLRPVRARARTGG